MSQEIFRTNLPTAQVNGAHEKSSTYLWGGLGMMFGLGLGLATYAYVHEPLNIDFEQLTIYLPQAKGCLPTQGLRILHLSDTHFQGNDAREQAKIERIRRLTTGLAYDLLIHTGDFWHLESGLPNLLTLLNTLPKPRLGSYGVFGNHDYTHYNSISALPRMWRTFCKREAAQSNGHREAAQSNGHREAAQSNGQQAAGLDNKLERMRQVGRFVRYLRNTPLDMVRTGANDPAKLSRALEAWGMEILHNRAIHLYHDTRPAEILDLYLAGVDDVQEGRPHLGHSLADVPAGKPLILLSHNPDILESPRIDRTDLVLSGHTHGGQIVLPLWGPAHTQVQYLSREHVAGYLRRGKTQVYITRGVGEGIPLRFGARPQITLITVKAE